MAAPNIVNISSMYGKVAGLAATTTATAIVNNSASSGKVLKVECLYVSNISASTAWATIDVYKNGATAYRITYQIVIPVNATLDVISRPLYLEENDSIRIAANASSAVEVVCSYEEIS